ncbi:hypothetical protein V6N11_057087 [Hibiscus sabdariffa]|uniref:Uncharacterized protein n=1 Tax=Hibiscus sabdariffa TaxID=183260 RepID=A0ABR1ZVX0_9ROSI
MLVFLNKKDLVDDELLQLDKLEVRKLFCSYDFTDNDVPIVFGFALLASQALMANPSYKSAQFLMSTINVIVKVTTIMNDKVVIPRFPSSTMASVSSDPLAVEEKIMAREAVKLVLPWSTWLTWPTYDLARDESFSPPIFCRITCRNKKTSYTFKKDSRILHQKEKKISYPIKNDSAILKKNSPDVNICTIGYVNHDKTSLTASPAMAFAYTTKRNRGYVHLDFCGHGDYVKYMITQDDRIDGAILLGSRADGSKA